MSKQHLSSSAWPVVETLSPAEKAKQVRKLPAPQPGVVVTVPLMLLPDYMQLHGRRSTDYKNNVLLVKREAQE